MISVEWEHRVYLSSASSYFGCFALEKDGSFVVIYQTSMDKLSSNGSLLWSTSSSSFYSPSPSPSLSSSITPSITSSMYSSPSPSPVTHSYSFSHSLSSSHSPSISYTPTPSISMSKSVDPYYNNDASLIAGKLTHPLVAANETLLYFPLQLHSKTGGIETYNLTDGSKLWNFYTQSEGITFLFPLPDPSSLLLIWHDVYYILSSSSLLIPSADRYPNPLVFPFITTSLPSLSPSNPLPTHPLHHLISSPPPHHKECIADGV